MDVEAQNPDEFDRNWLRERRQRTPRRVRERDQD